MVSVGRAIMDDLLFHELWLAKNKFRNFENEEESDSNAEYETDETSDEDSKNVKDLFKEEKKAKNKNKRKHRSISSNNSTEWFAVLLGVFFVAAIAGLASYQAYRSDFSEALSQSSTQAKDTASFADDDYVVPEGLYDGVFLPTNITPSKYILYIDIDLTKKHYKGLVKISFTSKNNVTNQIILYSTKTSNQEVTVNDEETGTDLKVESVQYNLKREMMIVTLEKNLTVAKTYNMFISFQKQMDYFAQGFYLSNFSDAKGNKQ